MYKLPQKLTIDLNNWRCGGEAEHSIGEGETALLNGKGYKCCLGFFCEQAGVPSKEIENLAIPEETNLKIDGLTKCGNGVGGYYFVDTSFTERCIEINDTENIPLKERIQNLKDYLKEQGYTLVVKGKKEFKAKGLL